MPKPKKKTYNKSKRNTPTPKHTNITPPHLTLEVQDVVQKLNINTGGNI